MSRGGTQVGGESGWAARMGVTWTNRCTLTDGSPTLFNSTDRWPPVKRAPTPAAGRENQTVRANHVPVRAEKPPKAAIQMCRCAVIQSVWEAAIRYCYPGINVRTPPLKGPGRTNFRPILDHCR